MSTNTTAVSVPPAMSKKTTSATSTPTPATGGRIPISTPCTVCGSTPCMALVRADVPTVGMIDLIDRTLARLTSGHWTARQSAHLGAIVAMVALAALVLTGDLSRMISDTAQLPWGWAYPTGGGLIAGGGYVARRMIRRRSQRSLAPEMM